MSRSPDSLPTSAFDYELPSRLIAHHPVEPRDQSRLMVLRRDSDSIEHRHFHDLAEMIPPGDALVLNETRVLPARLLGRRSTGGEAEVLLLQPVDGLGYDGTDWSALVRPGVKLKPGRTVKIAPELEVEILDVRSDGSRTVRLHTELPVLTALKQFGRMPLPPYIDRAVEPADADRYQTVFARSEGSVAAPTAGLHFTDALLRQIEAAGVTLIRIVLHVGAGTFRPVEAEDPSEHVMHSEAYDVSEDAAGQLNRVRGAGGKIWAVGTTVARTLETICDQRGAFKAGRGWTDIYIRPAYHFRGVDHLITNFHLPRSTLLMLVAAFAGYDSVMKAYRTAIDDEYRFYSYGDAMVAL
ncbi:MAG: tRNA preQ1(34) S-adenosylmethionine ribosyltransferase-isomerase QueA [Gemmatimonadota bacterium]